MLQWQLDAALFLPISHPTLIDRVMPPLQLSRQRLVKFIDSVFVYVERIKRRPLNQNVVDRPPHPLAVEYKRSNASTDIEKQNFSV